MKTLYILYMKCRLVIAVLCLVTGLLTAGFKHYNCDSAVGSVASFATQPEAKVHAATQMAFEDSFFERRWAMQKIMATQAWEITSGDDDIIIAVLDTGIDQHHEDLTGAVVAQVNFTGSPTIDDRYGHGTHVAGIIAAAANNDIGIAGLAYGCRLTNVKVADDSGSMECSAVAKGVIWAVEHGAKVINISLVSIEPSIDLEEAVNYAWSQGAVVIAAAGNCIGEKLAYPACYTNCLAVAATDIQDSVASWSSCSDWVDVAAPGIDIYSTLPANRYGSKSGTSMAAAYVSGLAGLLFAIVTDNNSNGFVNDEVRAAIENTCDALAQSGIRGRINASSALNRLLVSR